MATFRRRIFALAGARQPAVSVRRAVRRAPEADRERRQERRERRRVVPRRLRPSRLPPDLERRRSQYQITVDDPVTYVKPFTVSLPLTPLDGGVLLPYECHEGNYAVRQSLGAERAADAARGRAVLNDAQGCVFPR